MTCRTSAASRPRPAGSSSTATSTAGSRRSTRRRDRRCGSSWRAPASAQRRSRTWSTASSTSRSSPVARSPSRRSSERWASRWWRPAPRAARCSCSSCPRRSGLPGREPAPPALARGPGFMSRPRLPLVALLAVALAARLGLTPEVVWWRTFYGARAVRNTLLADTCDAYVGLPADAAYMDKKVAVTRPFLDVGYAIMAPPSIAFARLDDLKPYRVAVEFRSPPQSLVATRDGFSVSTFRTAEEAVDALGRREVDAAFVWGPIAGYMNGAKYKGAYRVVPVAGKGMQWGVAIGVRKEDEALRQRLDDALGQLGPEIRRAAEHYGFPLSAPVELAATPAPAAATAETQPGAPAAPAGGASPTGP